MKVKTEGDYVRKINEVEIPQHMYISSNGGVNINNYSCHSAFQGSISNYKLRQYFAFNNVPYTIEEIIAWVELMNDCGFKCDIVFEDASTEGNPPYNPPRKFDFYIAYNKEDYLSLSHWRTGFTAIRMLNYSLTIGLSGVPRIALDTYKKEGFEDAYFTLTSAFKGMKTTECGGGHNLMSEYKILNFKPITRAQLEEKCREFSNAGPNSVSTN